jgi:hypothetical protein
MPLALTRCLDVIVHRDVSPVCETMWQHFLLSAKARTLSLASVARMSEEEARDMFRKVRWAANDGEPSICTT